MVYERRGSVRRLVRIVGWHLWARRFVVWFPPTRQLGRRQEWSSNGATMQESLDWLKNAYPHRTFEFVANTLPTPDPPPTVPVEPSQMAGWYGDWVRREEHPTPSADRSVPIVGKARAVVARLPAGSPLALMDLPLVLRS